jgi:two-component system, OmpR family, sensor kinase
VGTRAVRSAYVPRSAPAASRTGGFRVSHVHRARQTRRRGALRSARARLMVSYVVLLVLAGVAGTVGLRQALIERLEDRIHEAQLDQEVSEMRRLLEQGRDPRTGEPFGSDLRAAFDLFFSRNIPSDDEALITFVEGRRHRADLSRYPLAQLPQEAMAGWAQRSRSVTPGAQPVSDTFDSEEGTAYYALLPVRAGDTSGAFVVAVLPETEMAEIGELQRDAIGLIALVTVLAGFIGIFLSRRVLEPVKLIADTARSISQADLTRRVRVSSPGSRDQEAVDMVASFNGMLDRLETVFEHQREFLRDVGHELRVPLTIAVGQLEMMSHDPDERQRTVELVIDELERASRIVDDLRVLAEADHPRFIEPEPVDLGSLTEDLLAKARGLAPREWVLEEIAEGTIVADGGRLTQGVMNLAQNAVQNTSSHDAIAVGSAIVAGEARIWVRDWGPGIPLDEQERVAQRFERGRRAGRRYRGAGLGLSIVQAIAGAHGGRMEIESRPGAGTCVTMVLPTRQPVQPPLEVTAGAA